MQRVVRYTLAGLMTVAGLSACGDKVTLAPQTSTTNTPIVRQVTVTPAAATISVGGSINLAASVEADAGISSRTVNWTSSDATVATVDANGKVTGVKAGTVTITATAAAQSGVSGAAVITVGAASGTGTPTISIGTVNQTNGAGQSVPANLANVAGQLDVTLNVDANGGTIRTIVATLTCGTQSITAQQTVSSANVAVVAEESSAPVTLSFNTAGLNATNAPLLRNGQCTISAQVTTPTGTQSTSNVIALTLNNPNFVIVSTTTTGSTASDVNGLPWKSGSVIVTVTPVIYNAITVSTVTVTLPGLNAANGGNGGSIVKSLTAGAALVDTFPNLTTGSNRVGQVTLVAGYDGNGLPIPVTPTVSLIDSNGNDVVGVVNGGPLATVPVANTSVRLDNQSPAAPVVFQIPFRQGQWVNASYVFTGIGPGTGSGGASGSPGVPAGNGNTGPTGNSANANYISGGDAGVSNGTGVGTANSTYAGFIATGSPASSTPTAGTVVTNIGTGPAVNAGVSGSTGVNGQTSFSYYYIAASAYTPINTNGTSTSATTCDVTAFTKITTAGDIPVSTTNAAYVARVVETDKLGNLRCTDLALSVAPGISQASYVANIGTTLFGNGARFGVDKAPPTVAFQDPTTTFPNAASANQTVGIGGTIPVFMISLQDDLSGFSTTPVNATLTRLAIDPSTGLASSTTLGTASSAFGCVIGYSASAGTCSKQNVTSQIPATINADGSGTQLITGIGTTSTVASLAPLSGGDGYYTLSPTVSDNARNDVLLSPRTILIDRVAPTVGGIQTPSTIIGGTTVGFTANASDNVDLISSNFSLQYGNSPSGNPAGGFVIRAAGPTLGTAFDNTLTTQASVTVQATNFIRDLQTTNNFGAPQMNQATGAPTAIQIRVVDAAGNTGASGGVPIQPGSVPLGTVANPQTVYANPQAPGVALTNFLIGNAATNISNCPAAGCTGGAASANPTSITLVANAYGSENTTTQFQNPFNMVQFYYYDPTIGEYQFIGSTTAPTVTDNSTTTVRTYTYTLPNAFDPPPAAGSTGPLYVVAIGVNASGDALATPVFQSITLTNP